MTAGRFLLPRVLNAVPTLMRGTMTATRAVVSNPVTNNPIKSILAVGIANKATDGAVGDAALRVGEGTVKVASHVVGPETVANAGKAALGAVTYAGEGLAQVGVSAAKRYGPDALDSLPTVLPKGLGAAVGAIKNGAKPAVDKARDVVADGGISVEDTKRAGNVFREKASEVAESIEDVTGGIVTSAEMKKFGEMVKREATTNKFIQAGLLLGGLSGAMKGENWMTKGPRAVFTAICFAAIFGAVGHYMFGKRSELVETVSDKLSSRFNNAMDGVSNTPVASVEVPALKNLGMRPRDMSPTPSFS